MLKIDRALCNKDGLCVRECPAFVIGMDEQSGYPVARGVADKYSLEAYCIRCGHCVLICPTGALAHSCHPPDQHAAADMALMPTAEQVEVLLKTRRSTRQFKKTPVPRQVIMRILEACNYAPTASNRQETRWIIVENLETKNKLSDLHDAWLLELLEADPEHEYARRILHRIREYGGDPVFRNTHYMAIAVMPRANEWPADADIALTYFELFAHSLGLGVCLCGLLTRAIREYRPLREALGISEDEVAVGVQLFGYPLLKPYGDLPPRKPLDVTML